MEKKNGKKPQELASVAEKTLDDNDVGVDLLSVSSGNNVLLESWVLDSACSYHMTPKKYWFDMYKPYNGGLLRLASSPRVLISTCCYGIAPHASRYFSSLLLSLFLYLSSYIFGFFVL